MSLFSFLYPQLITRDATGATRSLTRGLRLGGKVFVIPRGQCTRSRKNSPRTDFQGQRAAREQVRYEASVPNPGLLVVSAHSSRNSGLIDVWSWDNDEIRTLLPHSEMRVIPESIARQSLHSGARIVEGLDGFEAEIWHQGNLVISRWWPNQPEPGDWNSFVQSAKTFQSPDLNDFAVAHYREMPDPAPVKWKTDSPLIFQHWRSYLEAFTPYKIGMAVTLAAVAPIACETTQFAATNLKVAQMEAKIEAQRPVAATWLNFRQRALNNVRFSGLANQEKSALYVLQAFEALIEPISGSELQIERVTYIDGELRLRMSTPFGENSVALVSQLEQSPIWENVRLDARANEIVGSIVHDPSLLANFES